MADHAKLHYSTPDHFSGSRISVLYSILVISMQMIDVMKDAEQDGASQIHGFNNEEAIRT